MVKKSPNFYDVICECSFRIKIDTNVPYRGLAHLCEHLHLWRICKISLKPEPHFEVCLWLAAMITPPVEFLPEVD